nr:response regulator [Acidobacteriota bacterium]
APLDADAAARALDTIERNLRQQTQLINDMLDVSRIVTGKLVFHLTTLPLVSVVRETIDELRPQAEAKTVRVDVTTTGDLFVVADRERVRQVVSNLFTNAVKFTPPGGAVSITCREHQGSARLEVRDTGLGIAADQLPRIFERFRQADTSLTREHEGLGLGLSITRYIVNHLGGSIEADSDGPGRGSCFSVQFPLAAGVHAAAVPVAASSRPASSRRLAGLDLLVVDDHLDTVELVAFVLRRQGALVRTAASAPEALAAIAAHPAQVLVTDLSMPGMDGFALLAQVRALPDGAAVHAIALSGLARPDDRRRALAAGFSAHLAKPIEPATLVDAVERLTADPALGQAAPS